MHAVPGPPIATVNPATGELLESFEPMDAGTVEAVLATAQIQRGPRARSTFTERARLLVTAAELLEGEVPDIAATVTTEMGKPSPRPRARWRSAPTGSGGTPSTPRPMLTDREALVDASLGLVTYQPLGVVLAIMPWNFPLWQVARFLAPAVMAGNFALLKHAPSVPRTARSSRTCSDGPGPPTACSRPSSSAPTSCRRSSPTDGWPPSP